MSNDNIMRKEVAEFFKDGLDVVNKLLNKISKTANPETRQGVKKTSDLSYSAVYCLEQIRNIITSVDIYSKDDLKDEEIKKITEVKEILEKRIALYPKSNKGNFYASRNKLGRIYSKINELKENFSKLNLEEIDREIDFFISSIHDFSDEERFEFQVKEDERQMYKAIRTNKRYF
jgi:hypothetical protein